MIIGITGGTGCGKTTLLSSLEEAGVLVLDCDSIYHRLLQTDAALLSSIEARFPGTVENGCLQRKKLGSIVFSDKSALQDLNRLTHRAICGEVHRLIDCHTGHCAIDAIALFESGLDKLCDVTVAITAPLEIRVARLMSRDNISEEYARSRIAAQPSEEWFRKRCDHVLENADSKEAFQSKCLAFLRALGIMK